MSICLPQSQISLKYTFSNTPYDKILLRIHKNNCNLRPVKICWPSARSEEEPLEEQFYVSQILLHKSIDLLIAESIKKKKLTTSIPCKIWNLSEALRCPPPSRSLFASHSRRQLTTKGLERNQKMCSQIHRPREEHLTIRPSSTRRESSKSILLLQLCSKDKPHLTECKCLSFLPLNKTDTSCGKRA